MLKFFPPVVAMFILTVAAQAQSNCPQCDQYQAMRNAQRQVHLVSAPVAPVASVVKAAPCVAVSSATHMMHSVQHPVMQAVGQTVMHVAQEVHNHLTHRWNGQPRFFVRH